MKMADLKALEHPTLKVPYELLNKKFRLVQKNIDRDVSHINISGMDVEKQLSKEGIEAGEISRLLGGMVQKLQVLKRKAEESITEELQVGLVCKRRIEHLTEHSTEDQNTINYWQRKRLDRMLVEYFLRQGYYSVATLLAESSNLKDLTNLEIFLSSQEIEESLANHEIGKCLAWCHDNRSKLRKLKSNIEFKLRIQEYVELVRRGKKLDAIKYARKFFSTYEDDPLEDIKHCMALLVFPPDTDVSPYKEMFDANRWNLLVEQFRQENYRLFQMAPQSVFNVVLEAGLSALKTPECYSTCKDSRNSTCPVCQSWLNKLAEPLPYAHCSQSRLVCSISGLLLNENNQPMMLPNGYVYGEKALLKMASENEGQVICPKTKEVFPYSKVEKVFVM